MAGAPDGGLDLILADPPYGVNSRDRTRRRLAKDDALGSVLPVFGDLYRTLKPGRFFILFYGWSSVDRFMTMWKATVLSWPVISSGSKITHPANAI